MATFIVGFDGKWQGKFDDEDEAIDWAREVATTGRTVEVITRRFGFCRFLTGFQSRSAPHCKHAGDDRALAFSSTAQQAPMALMVVAATEGVAGATAVAVAVAAEARLRRRERDPRLARGRRHAPPPVADQG